MIEIKSAGLHDLKEIARENYGFLNMEAKPKREIERVGKGR